MKDTIETYRWELVKPTIFNSVVATGSFTRYEHDEQAVKAKATSQCRKEVGLRLDTKMWVRDYTALHPTWVREVTRGKYKGCRLILRQGMPIRLHKIKWVDPPYPNPYPKPKDSLSFGFGGK